MEKRNVYASDGEYFIREFSDEEKDNYMKLMFPENDISEFYQKEENRELFWRFARNLKEIDYSIYNARGEYCGSLELKNYDTATPEIGINLLENYRNKGIAVKTIKMLAKKYYEENASIEYYALRVSSYNLHSQHVMEKLGAELAGEEETLLQKAVRILKDQMTEKNSNNSSKESPINLELNLEEKEEVIYRFHLLPDAFL